MRILITGGAGFIGSSLALHLNNIMAGAEIVCMDNLYRRGSELNLPRLRHRGIRFVHGDIRLATDFPEGQFDFLVECSAEPSVLAGQDGSPHYLFQTNVIGAYNCLEAARRTGARLIFLSTSRIYPVATLESHPWVELETRFAWLDDGTHGISSRGVSEAVPLSGARSLYGYTKLSAEQLIEEYRAMYGLKAVVNRCGVIAGPWQFGKVDQGVVALWAMAHLFDRSLSYIGYGGTGKQVRDVLHVQDLCDLIALQISHFDEWEGWCGNVAGGLTNSVSLRELTDVCREVSGKDVPIQSVSQTRPFDLRLFVGDCAQLLERTAWRPRRGVNEIVKDTWGWVHAHREDLSKLT